MAEKTDFIGFIKTFFRKLIEKINNVVVSKVMILFKFWIKNEKMSILVKILTDSSNWWFEFSMTLLFI